MGRKKKIIFLIMFVSSFVLFGQQKKYDINERPPKERKHFISLRRIFRPDKAARAAKKTVKKDERKKRKYLRKYKKARKKYWKHYNKDKEKVQEGGKKVYRRMKKNERKAKRYMQHKKEPWYKRIFINKQKKTKVKDSALFSIKAWLRIRAVAR